MKVATIVLVRPLQCPHCKALSYVPLRYGVFALFTWVLLSWLFILTALYFRNVLYLLGSVPAGILAVDKWLLKAPLLKLFDE
jgi:hypothetical protein